MLLVVSYNHEKLAKISFRETPTDSHSIFEAPFARATIWRLEDEFSAKFGNQQDNILGDDVWMEGVIDGNRIEVSLDNWTGVSIRALETPANRIILDIAASLERQPVEVS